MDTVHGGSWTPRLPTSGVGEKEHISWQRPHLARSLRAGLVSGMCLAVSAGPDRRMVLKKTALLIPLALLTTLALLAPTVQAAAPPQVIPLPPTPEDLKDVAFDPAFGSFRTGLSVTIRDANPGNSGIEVWQQDPDGVFGQYRFLGVPNVVAHQPVVLSASSANHDDLFTVQWDGTRYDFGRIPGECCNPYDPSNLQPVGSYTPGNFSGGVGWVLEAGSSFMTGGPYEDIVFAPTGDPVVIYFQHDGIGNFLPPEIIPLPASALPEIVKIGDVTGDGTPDILVGDPTNGHIHVIETVSVPFTRTRATFSLRQTLAISGLVHFDVAPLNGDGPTLQDLVVVTSTGTGELGLYENNAGSFGSAALTINVEGPTAVVAGDVEGNGVDDVHVLGQTAGVFYLHQYSNPGNGMLVETGIYQDGSGSNRIVVVNSEYVGTSGPISASVYSQNPSDPNGSISYADQVPVGAGPDPSQVAEVRLYRDGSEMVGARFFPYSQSVNYGVRVGSADIDGLSVLGGSAEVLTGPERTQNLGPHARAFRRSGTTVVPVSKVSFFAYGTLRFGVGLNGGQLDSDLPEEMVTGPGPGGVFGPHVRGWNFDNTRLSPIQRVNFFSYQTLKWGVYVRAGDVDADSFEELLTGPGPSPAFVPQIRGWNVDGANTIGMGKINFIAGGAPLEYGSQVDSGDVDEDGFDEIVLARGAGANQTSQFRGFDFDNAAVAALPGYDFTPFSTMYGGKLALGDVDGDLNENALELIAGAGPDPSADSTVVILFSDGSPGTSWQGIPGATYGVNPAAAKMAF